MKRGRAAEKRRRVSVNLLNCQIFYSTRYCGEQEISAKKKTKYSIDINAKMVYTVGVGQN